MKRKKGKYFYQNLLGGENITAKTNTVWAADFTQIKLPKDYFATKNPRLEIFICIDIHTNVIIAYHVSLRAIRTRTVINGLGKAIGDRFPIPPKRKLIIHTDRGTQFTSKMYYDWSEKAKDWFTPSMSRPNTPTDNAVAERFMRTFKEHKIKGKTLQQALEEAAKESKGVISYRNIIKQYVTSLNFKPNRKSSKKAPERHDIDVTTASMFMAEPRYPKAFSEHYGTDFRNSEIKRYQQERDQVTQTLNDVLAEMAAKRAEVVQNTPFDTDDHEKNAALKYIDQRLADLYQLVATNPQITREYVEEAIQPVQLSIDELHNKIDTLLPKNKKVRNVQPLRDPVTTNLYPIFMANAGSNYRRQRDLKQAQLRILYTILYYTGMRINEARHISQHDIEEAIETAAFDVIVHKTKKAHNYVITNEGVEALKRLQPECDVIFKEYKYHYLFGKEYPMHEKTIINKVNKDLQRTCQSNNMAFNIKSHSFRVNVIANLLKVTSVQNAADIIGHEDLRSTMYYKRYALSKKEIQDLMTKFQKEE